MDYLIEKIEIVKWYQGIIMGFLWPTLLRLWLAPPISG